MLFYHPDCHSLLFVPDCTVCGGKIPPDPVTRVIMYSETPYWKQKFCNKHLSDGTKRCFACQRIASWNQPLITLKEEEGGAVSHDGEGRAICEECAVTVVASNEDAQVLYEEMRTSFFKDKLGLLTSTSSGENKLVLPEKLPVHLVATQVLNENASKRRETHNRSGSSEGGHHTMGLTMSEKRVTFVKKIGQHLHHDTTQVVSRQNEVTAILILHGLPRLLFCSVMAHECTHAMFRLSDYPPMNLQVEEGLCQLISYLWLQGEGGGKGASHPREKERVYYINKIFEEPSEVYGQGFRDAFEAYTKYGLKRVMDHVKLTQMLPC